MTPEQRLDRAERILIMMTRAGRRARSEWREKVNILINAHIQVEDEMRKTWHHMRETDEQIKNLAVGQTMLQTTVREGHMTLQKEIGELAQAVRDFVKRQERNGK